MSRARPQARTRRVSTRDIVASKEFARGLDEVRKGLPFNPDNDEWGYEVADFANLSASVLYDLAAGHYREQEEAAILAATREGRVDTTRADAICEKLAPPDDDDDDHDHGGDDHHDGDNDAEPAAAEEEEITAIIDGLPPKPPAGSTENLAPPNFALDDFDQAIGVLKRLMTKSAAQFAGTSHSADDLRNVASFIRAVMGKAETKAVTANGGTEPPR